MERNKKSHPTVSNIVGSPEEIRAGGQSQLLSADIKKETRPKPGKKKKEKKNLRYSLQMEPSLLHNWSAERLERGTECVAKCGCNVTKLLFSLWEEGEEKKKM